MKPSFLFYIALISALVASPSTQCNGLMRKLNSESQLSLTCRKTTQFEFCAYTLGTDPQSAAANVNGLAHTALDMLADSTKNTLSYLQRLQGSVTGNGAQVVGNCIQVYRAITSTCVPIAIASLNSNAYIVAKQAVGTAMNGENGCQLEVDHNPSPKWQVLSAMNKYTHDLSQLATDLIKLLG